MHRSDATEINCSVVVIAGKHVPIFRMRLLQINRVHANEIDHKSVTSVLYTMQAFLSLFFCWGHRVRSGNKANGVYRMANRLFLLFQ